MSDKEHLERRIESLRSRMRSANVDAAVVLVREGLNWETCFYLSGFRGSSCALALLPDDAFLVTDGRYLAQAAGQTHLRVIDQGAAPILDVLKNLLSGKAGIGNLGFQADRVTCDLLGSLKNIGGDLVDISVIFSGLRRNKDPLEVGDISKAAEISAAALTSSITKAGQIFTEKGFAARLEYEMKTAGAEGGWGAQEFIVASGPRSAFPHGVPTDRRVMPGENVTVDFGSRFNGYICDITRTLSLSEPPAWIVEAHDLLVEAQAAALPLLEPGRPTAEADRAARSVIERAGFKEAFTHSLGHGIGLDVHEAPVISSRSGESFAVGDVVTVEPGIYFPGKGGVRLEDDYHISDNGPVCLTSHLPRKIFVVDPEI
ncbi:MAG: aminopeptidase P family protein [Thermovirgaceae bacterium]|nr:aminopeptidase P family protein [Thermovirgaceae bacterium]